VPSPDWLIYALGGGWGHMTRAVALARAARVRHSVRILTNSPDARYVQCAMPELDIVALDASLSTPDTRAQAVRCIADAQPRCLIVDTFPRGLGGELARLLHSIASRKVLVHRDLNPEYVVEAGLRAFVESAYDLILVPGEGEGEAFGSLPRAALTNAWLIRDPQPAAESPKGVLVCASGRGDEAAWYGEVVVQLLGSGRQIRCVAPSCPPGCPRELWAEYWPAAELLPSAEIVVGGAGYNTVHECRAFGIPLIAKPWPRLYDRQLERAERAAKKGTVIIVESSQEAAAAIQTCPLRTAVQLGNGAWNAVRAIESA